ncbi:hypothetical protein GCM10009546_64010 [Actinomadura livida]|uniref:Uncharacterized protein n=1 Tax=Actinomadura livida TaxID=79909 RepID=A0ABN1FKM8_9ACTN|nr:hypothetical protein GCM10010208_07980 [Actinomadura livida]
MVDGGPGREERDGGVGEAVHQACRAGLARPAELRVSGTVEQLNHPGPPPYARNDLVLLDAVPGPEVDAAAPSMSLVPSREGAAPGYQYGFTAVCLMCMF